MREETDVRSSEVTLDDLLIERKSKTPKEDATKIIVYFEVRIDKYADVCAMFGLPVTCKRKELGAKVLRAALTTL